MDIEQMKKYFKNKIDSEKLTKKVRDVIKTTDWQKQDMREGFKESFSPLIESQDSIKKSIDEQQNTTIEQLKKNQLALTDKENKLEQLTSTLLAIMDSEKDEGAVGGKDEGKDEGEDEGEDKYEDAISGDKDDSPSGKNPKIKTIKPEFFDKYLNNLESQEILSFYNINNLPSYYFNSDSKKIENIINYLLNEINEIKLKYLTNTADINISNIGFQQATPRNINPRKKTINKIVEFNVLNKYLYQMQNLYKLKSTVGKGINNYKSPFQLLDRLELLGGSIIAGNNGVLQEFSEIAHLLARMKVITKKQLNELIETYITNR